MLQNGDNGVPTVLKINYQSVYEKHQYFMVFEMRLQRKRKRKKDDYIYYFHTLNPRLTPLISIS